MNEVLFQRTGLIGKVILNRPAAINALTHRMVLEIEDVLRKWAIDDGIQVVVLTGAGERGLCAGADILAIYRDAVVGGTSTRDFWRDEFRLNALIARYPKPFVAVMDGLVMGGGIGLSAHASHRVVTERTRMAFPETGLGLVPDVGSTWLLANAPGELGIHAALTGVRLDAGDALELGMADAFVDSGKVGWLVDELTLIQAGEDTAAAVESCLQEVSVPGPGSALSGDRGWIDACYSGVPAEEIVPRLLSAEDLRAKEAARQILLKSPSCVKVALESIRRARSMTGLEKVLEQEFQVSLRCLAAPDLIEGLRSQVIDKDRNAVWVPASLGEVTRETVQSYFTPVNDGFAVNEL
ncbi:enoyl-CoA hydratase/isomerase family protein [Arthrobacter sp. EpRS71]|uniref:enoyl-CoA hydratase/isomerase family protein n=1 Tax=Arthrobacter sp. EpRS71 TaxID=1743141 RepID=UPI000749B858|nr:enoyl-CoA hydratase/isomerase family protein [Arthrobacter sp. EpRS71]KUM42222.1 3-hydroxyisobutyryl-CoA hydrolase [Arthrobacter sp. EpRS71]